MRVRTLLIGLLALLLGVHVTVGQNDLPQLDITNYTLDNGLEVILVEDHSAPTVAVDIWYRVGAAHDPAGRGGFAHLFEHMMFEGSAHVGNGEFDNLLTKVGGVLNAYTSTEITGYYEVVPSHQLPLALWLDADRMASLAVNTTNLNNQRAVVIEEYQFRVTNSPYGEAFQQVLTLPYDYEPYRKRPIGNVEDLNAASLEDVAAFHSTYYVPNNATLVVAGDIDVEVTRELIDQFFGPIPAGDPVPELPPHTPEVQTEAVTYTIEDPLINIPSWFVAYAVPGRTHPDFPALDLLARILAAGDSSRLARSAVDTGMAVWASHYLGGRSVESLLMFNLDPNEGVEFEELEQIYEDELNRIIEEGVPADELEKVINQTRSGTIFGLETALELAEGVQAGNYYYDNPLAMFSELERYAAVTSEDIQRVAREYLKPNERHIFYVIPSEEGEPPALVEPAINEGDESVEPAIILEQDTPPEPLPLREFALPEITETTLDNGLDVIVVRKPELPLLSVDLYLAGGTSAGPDDKPAVATLTANLLTRGTETRTAQDIASTVEGVGGSVGASASADALTLGIAVLSEDTELAFELLGDLALNSIFPEQEVELQRDLVYSDYQYGLADPAFIARRAFNNLIYGEGHPYGRLTTGESIQSLTREDIVAYYEQERDPNDAFLIVAGDITVEEAVRLAEATFGDWEATGAAMDSTFEPPSPPDETTIYLIDRPGSSQAQFVIGNLGPVGSTDERYRIQVMNQVFGGGFNSRLNLNLREDKGYTYGINSSVSFPVDRGVFSISSAIGNIYAGPALQEILAEIERIREEPVPTEELEDVKSGMIGRYALALETYQSFIDRLASLKLRGLPLSDLEEFVPGVERVGQEDVQQAARDLIDADNLVIVVVGDADVIRENLEAVAPVLVIEPEE